MCVCVCVCVCVCGVVVKGPVLGYVRLKEAPKASDLEQLISVSTFSVLSSVP